MQHILILGAGLSSSYLIKYLLEHASHHNWTLTVADSNISLAQEKTNTHQSASAIALDVNDSYELAQHISEHDLVISLLPPSMHIQVAKTCIQYKKHLITASYVSEDMRHLHTDAIKAGIVLLNEIGLDPGIDHMSAMEIIHQIQESGGNIVSFKSYTGGLIAPEYDDNPWHYKFTWNPRNVVLAGQATASYIENNELKFIPTSRIFKQTEKITVDGHTYEGYANRDSLEYIKPYGLTAAKTVLRGTLRVNGFCESWNHLILLGLTDNSFAIKDSDSLTYRSWLSAFTPGTDIRQLEKRVCDFLKISIESEAFQKLKWLGLFENVSINMREGTPAQILQMLLQQKWKLQKGELDMIVMQHQFVYELNGKMATMESSLVVKGEDEKLTAMSKTVGLPMAIATKLLLTGKINTRGVQIPTTAEFYQPILKELKDYGILFH
jgi:saccharopine dehydrogenase-like NADP-dependent oxidoreductase